MSDDHGLPPFPEFEPKPKRKRAAGPPKPRKPRINMAELGAWIRAEWADALRHNELAHDIEVRDGFPAYPISKGVWRPFQDPGDLLNATEWVQRTGLPSVTTTLMWDAIRKLALETRFHPVRDYFESLPEWDRDPRIHKLFVEYFNAKMPADLASVPPETHPHVEWLRDISIRFMLAAVARVMLPGCKADYVPVVVGPQGTFKSTAIAALCPDTRWFTDNISPNLIERDTKESLAGKWIIELAEMPHIQREVERVKVFLSTTHDRYRASYGRKTQDYPRQCVFIGSANKLDFLDDTGNRRFWPFEIAGFIKVEDIHQDRDLLWAEAYARQQAGEQWWPPADVELIAIERQSEFVQTDIWDKEISEWAVRQTDFTLNDLFTDLGDKLVVGGGGTRISRSDQMRAASRLRMLGWKPEQRREGERRVQRWAKEVLTRF